MQGIDSDLIRGHIDTIILKVLSTGDKYGFEICKEVEEKSGGAYELKQPTLYSCLKRLEGQKLISSYWEDSDIGGKRHYYKLTDLGKETYRQNQEDWTRSRQIIDNLIQNGESSPLSFASNDEESKHQIKSLEDEIENLKQQLKEKEENPTIVYKEKIVESTDKSYQESDKVDNFNSTFNVDDDEIVPWGETQKTEAIDESQDFQPAEQQENKITQITQDGEEFNAEYAPNGEILSLEKANETETQDESFEESVLSEDEEKLEEELEENSPAQASVFDDENQIFDDETYQQGDNTEDPQDVDIMELLGHTSGQRSKVEEDKKEEVVASSDISQEPEEDVKPFNFRMDDFVVKSKESYFESNEDIASSYQYLSPEEKIEKEETDETLFSSAPFDFDKFKKDKLGEDESDTSEDEKESENNLTENDEVYDEPQHVSYDDEIYQTPVYHNFSNSIQSSYENNESDEENKFDDQIYNNSEGDEDNNSIAISDNKADENSGIFDDILESNNEDATLETQNNATYQQINERVADGEIYENANQNEETSTYLDDDKQKLNELLTDNKLPDFYKSTNNYQKIQPTFTEEEYKEKLSSLMSYGTYQGDKEEPKANFEFEKLSAPKDFTELKINFEREGIKVKTHKKLVKESKDSKSYVESNKLNLVNSWTAFGFVTFITLLTYLIMNAYHVVDEKIFLIGIACLSIVPIFYTILYFINPYKKKSAKYASKVYMLFAILITIQLLIITYCVNLQLGFYSFKQEGYQHLYWIVPSLISIYPLADAILHTIYFKSKNFHI